MNKSKNYNMMSRQLTQLAKYSNSFTSINGMQNQVWEEKLKDKRQSQQLKEIKAYLSKIKIYI